MRYSLTLASKKQVFFTDTKLWILYLGFVFVSLFFLHIFLAFYTSSIESGTKSYEVEIGELTQKITKVEKELEITNEDGKTVSRVLARNSVIKDSLGNLFDLVPDQIYLSELGMNAKALRIKGNTPSKEVYNFFLKPPLQSIFKQSTVSFFPHENGWFSFESISESQEEIVYEKK